MKQSILLKFLLILSLFHIYEMFIERYDFTQQQREALDI